MFKIIDELLLLLLKEVERVEDEELLASDCKELELNEAKDVVLDDATLFFGVNPPPVAEGNIGVIENWTFLLATRAATGTTGCASCALAILLRRFLRGTGFVWILRCRMSSSEREKRF